MTDVLPGQTAGIAVWNHLHGPSGGAGEVLAVYHRSLLWLPAPDEPVTLSLDPGQRGPVVLEAVGDRERLQAVGPGVPVVRAGPLLHFGAGLSVALGGVALWDEPLPDLTPDGAGALADAIRRALSGDGSEGGSATRHGSFMGDLLRGEPPATPWAQAGFPPAAALASALAAALASALAAAQAEAVTAAVAGLIGLGPGLTPGGDDFLAGVLAGLQCLGSPAARLLGDALERSAGRTTALSRQFLRWAVRGRYGETVRGPFVAARAGMPAAAAIASLLAVGATSGGDTAAGIWVGLSVARQDPALPALLERIAP
ncbi:MAG TPA: DUF2877 domain-containing protein [Symbiobacteriaceae bacterium]